MAAPVRSRHKVTEKRSRLLSGNPPEIRQPMKGHYELRNAILDDVDRLVEMQLDLQQHMLDSNKYIWQIDHQQIHRIGDYYRARLLDEYTKLLVVWDHESLQIVGTGMGRIMEHKGYIPGRSGEIDDIWIEPKHRKKGLARQLLQRLATFFKQHDIQHLILKYVEGNPEAEQVWERYGFHKVIITATTRLDQFTRMIES